MVNIAVVGVGLVGSELVTQLRSNSSMRIVALANSRRMLLSVDPSKSLDALTWLEDLESDGVASDLSALIDFISGLPHPIVVDCTSSDAVALRYPEWLEKGLNIVTPNKKGFSGSLSLYTRVQQLSSGPGPHAWVFHESTVGAGLPILSTLRDLVKTGDKVLKVEGIFSGTLSYIFNNFSTLDRGAETKTFSEIVMAAKTLGYTEPDPRDDLNGLDVARKVIIIGRAASLPLTLATLPIQNIVPEALQTAATTQEFLEKLPSFDKHFEHLNKEALANDEVLRYIGLVDLEDESQTGVKLVRYPAGHPFASLKGSDNIIKFTTQRFPNGLIIQGAGAGAAVTAFGIYSDLLKVYERLEKV